MRSMSLPTALLRKRWRGLLMLGCLIFAGPLAAADPPGRRYALVIGCSDYRQPNLPDLAGPANDGPLFAGLLQDDFGFDADQIVQLVGWPDDPARRPTYANIVDHFERLIARVREGDQVAILLSGHGTQLPMLESEKSARHDSEPDGLDEVFLPADVEVWQNGRVKNSIRDDQLGLWLTQLRQRGAAVWVLFDCCHSGTMARAEPGRERIRGVSPLDLGVPKEVLTQARRRAVASAGSRGGGARRDWATPLDWQPASKDGGCVVVFYAAQPFETTQELPRPRGASAAQENYFGLLTYTTVELLKQRLGPLSYGELAQALINRYTAERGMRGPTPLFEGALNREVLGRKSRRPDAAMLLMPRGNVLRVSAGDLHGLTEGAILAVYPPAGNGSDEVLGHVVVEETFPAGSIVVPHAYRGMSAPRHEDLPRLARCRLIARPVGEARLRLAVQAADKPDEAAAKRIGDMLAALPQATRELFQVTSDPSDAEWLLGIAGEQVEWRTPATTFEPGETRSHAGHRLAEIERNPAKLANVIEKIATWQKIWRIADVVGAPEGQPVDLEVRLLDRDDKPLGLLAAGTPVKTGQRIAIELRNHSPDHLWVSMLFLAGDCGIRVRSFSVAARKSLGPLKGTITAASWGREGIVVLAMPQHLSRAEPNLRFLEQTGLGYRASRSLEDRLQDLARSPPSVWAQLFGAAMPGHGRRSYEVGPMNPIILTSSWLTALD